MTFKQTRRFARTFAQVALDPGADGSIAGMLRLTRRVCRAIAPIAQEFRVGVDFSELSNARVTEDKVILFVRTTAQQNKLRQLTPRLSQAVALLGLRQAVEVRIRPVKPSIALRQNNAQGTARIASDQTVSALKQKAESLDDSALKTALTALARSLEH